MEVQGCKRRVFCNLATGLAHRGEKNISSYCDRLIAQLESSERSQNLEEMIIQESATLSSWRISYLLLLS